MGQGSQHCQPISSQDFHLIKGLPFQTSVAVLGSSLLLSYENHYLIMRYREVSLEPKPKDIGIVPSINKKNQNDFLAYGKDETWER